MRLLPLLLVTSGLVACGGSVERVPASHDEQPTAPATKTPSSSNSTGSNAEAEGSQCDGYPECNPGEEKVDTCFPGVECHDYTSCGVTIHCTGT